MFICVYLCEHVDLLASLCVHDVSVCMCRCVCISQGKEKLVVNKLKFSPSSITFSQSCVKLQRQTCFSREALSTDLPQILA